MQCPKCLQDNVVLVGDHYICNNPTCRLPDGSKTQFKQVMDEKKYFPYNQIFVNRRIDEFYRKPYLVLKNVGNKKI